MAKLIIDFEGLICHVGETKTHAVLVHEPTAHGAEIVAGGQTFHLRQWDTVSFEGPPPGTARTDGRFDELVPHLSRVIKNGSIFTDILNRKQALAPVVAYVLYPSGMLTAPKAHPSKLVVALGTGTPVTQCVAQGVRFESDEYSGSTTLVITHHDDAGNVVGAERFSVPSYVQINNASDWGNHFHEYLRLTSANVIAKVSESPSACTEFASLDATPIFTAKMEKEQQVLQKDAKHVDPARRARLEQAAQKMASINPECTNSQWP